MRTHKTPVLLVFLQTSGLLWTCLWLCGCSQGDVTQEVRGLIQDHQGQPVVEAVVTFWQEGSSRVAETTTDPTGHFKFRCPPGTYKVTVTPRSKAGGPGGPQGQLPDQNSLERSLVPEAYWKPELTKLTASVPGKGTDDLKLQLTAQGN